jgi:hypothetical protein
MFAVAAGSFCISADSARADKIKHTTAVFAGLDKITGRIISFEVAIDETVQFGTLQITPRVCYTRPPTEAPQTDGFVEVYEVDVNSTYKDIFSGWMFADSPGLHGVEHPVYDVWLTDCRGGTQLIPSPPEVAQDDQIGPAVIPPKPGATPRTAPARQANDSANGGVAPPLGPPVYVPSGPASNSAQPSASARPGAAGLPAGPRPPAAIPDAARRQPSQRYYPVSPADADNPYRQ